MSWLRCLSKATGRAGRWHLDCILFPSAAARDVPGLDPAILGLENEARDRSAAVGRWESFAGRSRKGTFHCAPPSPGPG